ncbi:aminoglycoside phosphotransferase (APT) family kinase protein [Micromonospora pisi]|uniref:Aminoglycoside phosphotransferase (APT) family kinase protein n=1 Tax=Micromonospora pisi TaxID=589240 RepID=A0A495JI38_9ACTN|nr:aminoglycoside phosphotransferase family protein [Micromonospora pisi]RKR88228.1 aminoglycoside phosphotransferase (APT) family kinase protein [Micromonospora pisi]
MDQDEAGHSDEIATTGEATTGGFPAIDVALVRRLIRAQFPKWADLPVRPVEFGGWDNRTFHLGEDMTVRLPSAPGYALQVAKEHRWLPKLAPYLPLSIPEPVAMGAPGEGYPLNWSVYRWIEGEQAHIARIADLTEFATTLAGFLTALRRVDATEGPLAGEHSAYRGGPLETYDAETRRAIEDLAGRIPADVATAVWETGLASSWQRTPVWFHGDVAFGNLLVREGRLAAVIDFGCAGVGDPACDLAVAWTLFSGPSREAFRAAIDLDPETWARGRAWTLWKALIVVAGRTGAPPGRQTVEGRLIDDLLSEYRQSGG